ncbi:MAG: hypothetical protein HQ446_01280 [Polaromonas sp.]|nr:hypothetical protein [Polaromonas sp.]
MNLEIECSGQALLMRAQTPADLDFLEQMRGIHWPGPWGQGEFIKIAVADLGFDPLGAGCSWVGADGRITATLGAVRLRVDWMNYREPPTADQRELLDAQQAMGQAVHQILRVLRVQAKADLVPTAAGVVSVQGNF